MDFQAFQKLVKGTQIGKQLPDSVYVHESAIHLLPIKLSELILKIVDALKINDDAWNIVKFYKRDFKITFLNYPSFEEDSYPCLKHSSTVDLQKFSVRKADYSKSENPPILHRKETFVADNYPLKPLFEKITVEGEKIGLYENTRTIGFKKNWERLISNKGYFLDEGGRLIPKFNKPIKETSTLTFNGDIERHKTAIDRNQLSQPMQVLARHNYLNGDWSILDYGCGKGDDVHELEAHGIDVSGWDPAHNLEGALMQSDIVNLGFVLNVIEEKEERTETLKRAWEYADKLLIVSVMVAGESTINKFQPYKDGVITSRNTFQKYYSQSEIRSYIETSLDQNSIPVGQGVFIVFKDKLEEQTFLSERQHIRRNWLQKTQRQIIIRKPSIKKDVIEKNIELFTDFWETTLELGRIPANSEFEFSEQIRRITGSHNKAHQALLKHFGTELYNEAQQKRKEDLLVYFALSLFEKRKTQTKMPESLKRDIKAFYHSYNTALDEAKEALFAAGDPGTIKKACEKAYEMIQCGYMEEGHSFTFHKKYLGDLPAQLRIYIGCATQLYGDLDDIQLIKSHITSGKVTLLRYDDWNKEIPMLVERIKIKLRELDIDFFDYNGKFEPQQLTNKALY
jgi:DNA phosphorothioation-associated putative methyltransferase